MAEVTTLTATITAEADGAVSSLDEVTKELKLSASAVKKLSTNLKSMGLDRTAKQFANVAKQVSLSQHLKTVQKNIEALADAAEKAGDKTTAAFLRENANPIEQEEAAAAAEEAAEKKAKADKAAEEEMKRYLALVHKVGQAEKKEREAAAKAAEEAAKKAEKAAEDAAKSEKAFREITNNEIIENVRKREAAIAAATKQAERQQKIGAQALAKAQAEASHAAVRAKNYERKQEEKAARETERRMKSAQKTIGDLGKAFGAPIGKIKQFISAIGRIALYRAIRTAIKEISSAIKEGLSNLKAYSEQVGTAFSPAVDNLRQHVLRLKNAFATALRPVIEALIPVIIRLVDWLTKAADFVAQVFSILTGKVDANGRYTKAVLSDLEKSNKQAKELRRTLLGFDEINRLDGDTGSGDSNNAGLMFTQADVSPEAVEAAAKLQKIIDKVKELLSGIDWDVVLKVLAGLMIFKGIMKVVTAVKKVFDVLKAVVAILTGPAGILIAVAAIIAIFAVWGDKIGAWCDNAKRKVSEFLNSIDPGTSKATSSLLKLISDVVGLVMDIVGGIASIVYKLVHGDLKGALEDGKTLVKNILKGILNIVIDVANIFLGLLSDVINGIAKGLAWVWNNALVPVINWVATVFAKAWVWLYNADRDIRIMLWSLLKWLLDTVNNALQSILSGVNSLIAKMNDVFGTDIQPIEFSIDSKFVDDKIAELEATKLPPITETVELVGKWKDPGKLNLTINTSSAYQAVNALYQKATEVEKKLANIHKARGEVDQFAIRGYASGGYPATGSLFVAGEAGPEIVASFGGQTGVWNSDQMYSALYSAMSAALAANPQGGGDIYLDGEVIYRNTVRRNNNQVRSTGRAALLT